MGCLGQPNQLVVKVNSIPAEPRTVGYCENNYLEAKFIFFTHSEYEKKVCKDSILSKNTDKMMHFKAYILNFFKLYRFM